MGDNSEKLTTADRTLLVVEDTDAIRKLLSMVLGSAGFSIVEAENGEAALLKLETTIPDLIICDLIMPVMDGEAFLQELKARQLEYPVVILSANCDDVTTKLGALGVRAVCGKTSFHTELIGTINKILAEEESQIRA